VERPLYGLEEVLDYIRQTPPIVHEPLTPPPRTVDLPELIDRLERARQSLREEIVKLSDMDLEDQCARGMKVGQFLRMVIRHDAWHGGQLAVIRRVYQHKR
jgi:hypothetical protein